MSITNPWLTPYQRSYQQIKSKVLDKLKDIKDSKGNTLITDYSEGNIFVLILSIFSSIAEVIHYYIDNMARETFFSTARRYDSLVKHGKLVDYHTHGAVAPTVDITVSRPVLSEKISAQLNIPKGSIFIDNSGNNWLVSKDVIWYANTTEVKVPCIQHTYREDSNIVGTVMSNFYITDEKARIELPSIGNGQMYEDGTMSLTIGDVVWTLVDTFAYSGKYDTHFIVEVDAEGKVYITFGDGIHGMKPDPGYKITRCNYYVTAGSNANVKAGNITGIPQEISSSISDATCSNIYPAGGGSDYEDFDMLKEHIPLHVRTLGVAITKQDFIDIAMQVPGVNKCAAEYVCGRKLNLYISPDNGGVASSELCNRVYTTLSKKAPLTTWLNIKPAGITNIILDITVTGNKSYSKDVIQDQITQALKDKYSISNSQIGGNIRLSDIYTLINNLSSVSYLHINNFYIKPWPDIIYGNSMLVINQFILHQVNKGMTYFITFSDDSNYSIRSKNGGFLSSGVVGKPLKWSDMKNNNVFSLDIRANNYKAGYKYSILISEPSKDYIEPGYNLPVFTEDSQLNLTVNEVL